MSRTVAWRHEAPVTEDDLAYQMLTTGGEDLQETVYHYLLRQELARLAHAAGLVPDADAVAARLAALEQLEGFAATLELMGIDADRFARELADEELVAAWMETEEPVSDDAVERLYQSAYRHGIKEGALRMRHILIDDPDREEARRRAERIAEEEAPFASKAERYSACPSAPAGGDLGWVRREQALDGFAPLFERTRENGPVVVETELGVHLVEVTDRREAAPLPPEEGRREARRTLATQARKERLSAILRQIRLEVRFAEEG